MKFTLRFYIALFLFASFSGLAQEKKIKKGNEEFNDYAFIDAREAYLKVAEDGYRDAELLKKLADSYYFTADYPNAAVWYGELYNFSDSVEPEYLYRYALSLKSVQQYDKSNEVMEQFYAAKGEDYRARLFVEERNYMAEIEAQSGRFELKEVGFNSDLSDFGPTFYGDAVVFSSNRYERGFSKNTHDWNDQPFLDLYIVPVTDGVSGGVKRFSGEINTQYHESTAVFSADGKTVYFTRNNYTSGDYEEDNQGINRLKLYRAMKEDGSWNVEELPFNSNEYSVAHPALSNDGKTLFFVSDMPGGKGQSDLYSVAIAENGFGTPKNLGDRINTEGRESFPFVGANDRLYFASNGHLGLGGLDVFVVDKKGVGFGDVYNVGAPINGPQDDFTFIINPETGEGYFASNRNAEPGDDNIYGFTRLKDLITSCDQYLVGTVINQQTKEPLGGVKVQLFDDNGNELATTASDANGKFSFSVECSKQYSLRASKENYKTSEAVLATTAAFDAEINTTLELQPGNDLGVNPAGTGSDLSKVLDLSPIYFDLDKSNIRPDAEIELRKVVAVMTKYPEMKIDVRSHTDSRANDAYNLALSERRAKSTVNWLVEQGGIDRSRLSGKGYGETELTNNCGNGVSCTENQHELNRRSEFIILN